MESNTENQPVHKRRVRYKGTHPRHYNEKYKELNPEKYGETVEKVIRKGGTPAGMHISIMVQEILDFLQDSAGAKRTGCYVGIWRAYIRYVEVPEWRRSSDGS